MENLLVDIKETENIIVELRAISSILYSMSFVEDNVKDNDLALSFLSARISKCSNQLADIINQTKNANL